MSNKARKYIARISLPILVGFMVFGIPKVSGIAAGASVPAFQSDTTPKAASDTAISENRPGRRTATRRPRPAAQNAPVSDPAAAKDSATVVIRTGSEKPVVADTAGGLLIMADTLIKSDTVIIAGGKRPLTNKSFLDEIITGKNQDSLVYDVRAKRVYIYRQGDITYNDVTNLKADYMMMRTDTKEVFAIGMPDTAGVMSRPQFLDKGASYTMDTITYNFGTEKAKIYGVATKEGEGYMIGDAVKKMPDNAINIAKGKYTTCDHIDHPHFYIRMTKAKVIPRKKVIFGLAYPVMEDVPLPIGLPFGFFPLNSGRSSGFIMPEYGEEYVKGFFIRNGGYYFAINDYMDVSVKGGFYTLGSWEADLTGRYIVRYKYSGNLQTRYSKDITGEKGSSDYVNMSNFMFRWSHAQDPKFKPNSTFAASVDFSTSGYQKYGSTTLSDYLSTQTNSSISYSKSWPGKPFSFSTNVQHSQNSADTTISLSFPNIVFSLSRINPFKAKNRVGKERWYEKISMSLTSSLSNNVTVHERDLFKQAMFDQMRNGIQHTIPISTSMTLFNHINITPSAQYMERWYFRQIDRNWDPAAGEVVYDTINGFSRLYNFNLSVSVGTKIYGMFQFKSPKSPVQAVRHMVTPSVGFSYMPDFSSPGYGYYKYYQSDSTGTLARYSPWASGIYGVPGAGENMSMNFSLSQTLEMKVKSDRDTTGVRKISIIDNFGLSASYNFLADSMNLSNISANLRTTLYKNFGLNISATLDPYQVLNVNGRAQRIGKYLIQQGKLVRVASASTSFGYSHSTTSTGRPAANDINSGTGISDEQNAFLTRHGITDPNVQRLLSTSQYYDFSMPWNFSFNYSFNYTNDGVNKKVTQTLGFNASVTPTPKWGVTMSGGYDFQTRKITPGAISFSRDLHCWEMSLQWIPVGYIRSWAFKINVRSSVLQDLKYDRRSSHYDNILD